MDSLRSMFPDLDPSVLQATLDAHDGSVERAVDYLLSSHTTPNPEQQAQEEEDAALARQLQAEDAAAYQQQQQQRPNMWDTNHPNNNTDNNRQHYHQHQQPGTAAPGFQLPSLADVQSAVQPIVNGVAYAGRVAANSVSGLYRDLVGDEGPSNRRTSTQHPSQDESVVLRGESASPSATRSSARQRRPDTSSFAHSFGDKKDD